MTQDWKYIKYSWNILKPYVTEYGCLHSPQHLFWRYGEDGVSLITTLFKYTWIDLMSVCIYI